jgi:16S rRNA G527 N7-methylase RsmG
LNVSVTSGRPESSTEVRNRLQLYRAEVLRWNTQINLISRQSPEAVLDRLVEQCLGAWVGIESYLAATERSRELVYIDIGSGNGLPGIVWHCCFEAAGVGVSTYLIEPRLKRAWFLERCARQLGLGGVRVVTGRWGEDPVAMAGASGPGKDVLISLRALRLDDVEVLAGLSGIAPQLDQKITIARFVRSDAEAAKEVVDDGDEAALSMVQSGEEVRWLCIRENRLAIRSAGDIAAFLDLTTYHQSR